MRTRVYVAGPITQGCLEHNIHQARQAGMQLLKAGYAPLVPHLTCFMAGDSPQILPEGTQCADWYAVDLPWVSVSHAVLRLPGKSIGADLETQLADQLGIPVFYDINLLIKHLPKEK